jgi:predicted nuclease with TOPRIM domain
MDPLKRTLDIEDERDDLAGDIEEIEERRDELLDEAMEVDPPEDEEERERFNEIEAEVDALEEVLPRVRGYLNVLDRAIEEWEGSEITMRELTGAEARAVKTRAQEKADRAGVDYSEDFHETLLLEKTVVSTPPEAPAPDDIGDLPGRMHDWLLQRANAINSVGEFEMGNSSLRRRMAERRRETED